MMTQSLSSFLQALLLALGIHSADGASSSAFVSQSPSFQSQTYATRPIESRALSPALRASQTTKSTHLHAGSGFGERKPFKPNTNNKPTSSSSNIELFELQELRAQLDTILKGNILVQNLTPEKREELSTYVKAVVTQTDSPIDFMGKSGNTMGIAQFVAGVENKSWRMVFSTDGDKGSEAEGGELPYGSSVLLRIGEFMGTDGKMDYCLKFSKRVMGLNELVAQSSCTVDIGKINPGLFTFTYEDIKTNIFGVSNLPVGFFGLLKGRVNCIDTVWFDGERWIERNYLENGDVVYSVYVRDVEDEKTK